MTRGSGAREVKGLLLNHFGGRDWLVLPVVTDLSQRGRSILKLTLLGAAKARCLITRNGAGLSASSGVRRPTRSELSLLITPMDCPTGREGSLGFLEQSEGKKRTRDMNV